MRRTKIGWRLSRTTNLKDKNLKTESGNGDFKEESDETYIMAKTSSNTQEGVIIKVYEPVVKGVAVVASGGES